MQTTKRASCSGVLGAFSCSDSTEFSSTEEPLGYAVYFAACATADVLTAAERHMHVHSCRGLGEVE